MGIAMKVYDEYGTELKENQKVVVSYFGIALKGKVVEVGFREDQYPNVRVEITWPSNNTQKVTIPPYAYQEKGWHMSSIVVLE